MPVPLPISGAYAVKVVAPVPPPGTVAVPKIGSLVAPLEINGIPADPGATKPTLEVPSPSNILCAVRVDKPVPP